jgi:hypothetical protein
VATADWLKVRPSARWYALVAVAWLLAAVCGSFAMKSMVDMLGVTPTPIANRSSVHISDEGLTVYAVTSSALCTLTDDSRAVIALDRVRDATAFKLTSSDGTLMYAVATTPDGLASGTYTLRCRGIGAGVLGVGDRVDIDGMLLRVGGMMILTGVFGVAGLIVLIVVLVKRHNSKARLQWAQAAYAGWGQWYASPYSGYPGYPDYPGYPPQQGHPHGAAAAPGWSTGQAPGGPPSPGWTYPPGAGAAPAADPTGDDASDSNPPSGDR